ncbi:hypothetical protein CFD26_100212, partial [Aspergillus turcosus]
LLANTSHQRVRQRRALGGGPEHLSPEDAGGRSTTGPLGFSTSMGPCQLASGDGDARGPVRSGGPARARGRLLTKGGGQLAGAHGRVGGARPASESGPPPERLSDPGTFARTFAARSRSVGRQGAARAGVRSSGRPCGEPSRQPRARSSIGGTRGPAPGGEGRQGCARARTPAGPEEGRRRARARAGGRLGAAVRGRQARARREGDEWAGARVSPVSGDQLAEAVGQGGREARAL